MNDVNKVEFNWIFSGIFDIQVNKDALPCTYINVLELNLSAIIFTVKKYIVMKVFDFIAWHLNSKANLYIHTVYADVRI